MRPPAQDLAKWGITSLIFDFHGYGQSEGVLDGDVAPDVIAAWHYLSNRPEINPERIALAGHSLGAMGVILAAAQLDGVYALVSLSCPQDEITPLESSFFSHHPELARESKPFEYPHLGPPPWLGKFHGALSWLWMEIRGYRFCINWQKSIQTRRKFKLSEALEKMKPRPILFVYCKGDEGVSYQSSLELYQKAHQPKKLLLYEGGFHSTPLMPGKVRREWIAWLTSVLTQDR
jgi:fermentation-respiration switch protein FrsA (DUF1100 family)